VIDSKTSLAGRRGSAEKMVRFFPVACNSLNLLVLLEVHEKRKQKKRKKSLSLDACSDVP